MFKYSVSILALLLFLTFKNYGELLSTKVKNKKIAIGIKIAYHTIIIFIGLYMTRLNEFKVIISNYKKYNEDIMTIILSIFFMFAFLVSMQAGNILNIIKKQLIKNDKFKDYVDFVILLIVLGLALIMFWLGIKI